MKKKSLSVLIAVAMATTTLAPSAVAFADNQVAVTDTANDVEEVKKAPASTYGITYDTHIQKRGWNKSVKTVIGDEDDITKFTDAGTSGTIGKSLRVEAIRISGTNLPEDASIEYEVHQQTFGWSKVASNGADAGVTGKGKRAEAIKVTLKGMPGYAIKYQVHVQKKGWMPAVVTENGTDVDKAALAGTTGEALRIEALRVQIVKTDVEKKAEVAALNAVAKAEAAKDQASKDAASKAAADVQDANVKADLTKRIDAIVVEDVKNEKVSADSIAAVSDTKVSVAVTEGQEGTADKLKDSKITLTDAEGNELTASFAALSEDGKTADYTLEGEDKLVDAATYTATSDSFEFKDASFMARVATDTYIKEVAPVTTGIVASSKNEGGAVIPTDIYLQAKNQYGEDMDFAKKSDDVKVSGTVNGVPLLDNEIVCSDIEKGKVTLNKELKENDKVQLTVTNKIGDKDVEVGTVSYVVGKAEDQVATTITGITAAYTAEANGHKVNDAAKEVMPDDVITLTPEVKDQFKNPMTGKEVRWVIEEGKDLITETSGSPMEAKKDAETLEFKAVKTGTLKISAYLENGEKFTYEVEIGAKQLQALNLTENKISEHTYNLDSNIIKEIAPNAGAVLTADMIKFDIKAGSDEVTAADVKVEAKLRGGDDEKTKNDIVIVAKSSKAGTYKITPYVGESLEKATVKGNEITYTTTVDQTVASIDDLSFDSKELKVGKDIVKDVVFRNKHGEVVVLSDDVADAESPISGVTVTVSKDTTNNKNILTVSATAAKTYPITISVGDVFATYKLTFAEPKLTSIKAGSNISGTVAGDIDDKAKYQEVKFLDQDGEAMDVKLGDLTINVTDAKGNAKNADGVDYANSLLTLGKTYSVDEKGKVNFEKATDSNDNVVAIKVLPKELAPDTYLDPGTYTVTIARKDNTKLKDSFTVSVGAKRAVKTVDVKADASSLTLGGETTLRITPKDQYGDLIKVNTSDIAITSNKCTVGSVEEDEDKDGNVIGYKATLTGNAKGTEDIKVDVKDGEDIIATNKTSIKVDSVGNLVDSISIDNSDIKDLYSTESGKAKVTLNTIAKDANNNVIPMSSSDLTWKVEAQKDAEGKDVNITASVDENGVLTVPESTVGTVKVSVTTSNQKEATIELNFSKDAAKAKAGTTTLVNAAGDDKVVDADDTKAGIQVLLDGNGEKDGEDKGVINFNVKAKDQYGEDFTVTTGVSAKADDTSVVKVEVVGNTVKLTAKGAGTANVYVTYNGDKIKLEVTVTQKALDAAKAAQEELVAAAKETLSEKIAEAETTENGKVEGEAAGNQIEGSKDTLEAAKKAAEDVYKDESATLQEINDATTTLDAAITAYTKAVVADISGSLVAPLNLSAASKNSSDIEYTLGEGESISSTSSAEGVATVSGLSVTAVTKGESKITVQVIKDGKVIKAGEVTVTVGD